MFQTHTLFYKFNIFTPCLPHKHIVGFLSQAPGERCAVREHAGPHGVLIWIHNLTLLILLSCRRGWPKFKNEQQQ